MTDLSPAIDAAQASAYWRSAKHWLTVWASAGFVPKEKNGKLFMPDGWVKKFPDGPLLVDALRTEMTALVRGGNEAVLADPRLKLAYPKYLQDRIDDADRRVRQAEYAAKKYKAEADALRAQLATLQPQVKP